MTLSFSTKMREHMEAVAKAVTNAPQGATHFWPKTCAYYQVEGVVIRKWRDGGWRRICISSRDNFHNREGLVALDGRADFLQRNLNVEVPLAPADETHRGRYNGAHYRVHENTIYVWTGMRGAECWVRSSFSFSGFEADIAKGEIIVLKRPTAQGIGQGVVMQAISDAQTSVIEGAPLTTCEITSLAPPTEAPLFMVEVYRSAPAKIERAPVKPAIRSPLTTVMPQGRIGTLFREVP